MTTVMLMSAAVTAAPLQPPVETGPFRPPELVEVTRLDPTIQLDVRYATSNNFVHKPVYTEPRVFLQRPAAEAVVRVNARLKPLGYGLILFDGYRPWSVTRTFWESTSGIQRMFVADPREGSRHNRGCAVDLTLYDLETGQAVTMPSDYDEMTERAYPTYEGGAAAAREHRDRLRAAMEAEGFSVHPREWWHYDYALWREYAILDVPFSALGH
ncbi:D-alanyl-D-alanine dipeptidase [Methylococcus capsulatus str. Bath]|uniref:D-alanyl-D-alanine dipeptidase n=1 Tax=Methylococcus capsulatus (strain ATCC 33009 / NCIMB 11132 / Bath) TaxID=243233 RepID=Q604D1_METCA|nr:M15 family metallopeptidase [Methylococcus capsulatus]AAU91292.1 D-alanyl-D-alanine dipeptidase [Methylococcus capsulatus str. Bath]